MTDPVKAASGAVTGVFNAVKGVLPMVSVAGLICIAASPLGFAGYAAAAAEGGGNLIAGATDLVSSLG